MTVGAILLRFAAALLIGALAGRYWDAGLTLLRGAVQ